MKVRESALIFLLVLSSFAANVVAPTKSELEAMYAAASRELNAGHYSEALKKLDAIDARQPDLAAAQNLRGVALMRQTEYRAAEAALRKAREIDPELWEARFNLAEVPFLMQNWTETRRRFQALAAGKSDQMQGVTSDLIQFKILLTFMLEGKEKLGAATLDKLQASRDSPAPYYVKAALALRQKNPIEAKASMAAAEKKFSPQLNQLFAESFYEVGWLQRPEGATPVALEVSSPGERVAQVQENFGKAERAYRQRDFASALQLLDQIDAAAPNQAVAYNLRGEILLEEGKDDEAEAAWRTALAVDPQFQEARFNLARVPFKKRDYKTSRQELEALLGATSGGKQQQQREQLIRYQIFLTLLLESRESPAQKAMEEFKMMDDTPALYYAQAAWAFQHGNARQGNNWVANANNLYSSELNRSFAAPFADLGWLDNSEAQPAPTKSSLAKADVAPRAAPSQTPFPSESSPMPVPVVAENPPGKPVATAESATAPTPPAAETPPPALATTDAASATPEASATPGEVASAEPKRPRQPTGRKKKRLAHAKPVSTPVTVSERPRQNFGAKVARLLLYPFQHLRDRNGSPAPAQSDHAPRASGQPSPTEQRPPEN
jgi:Flp pilus assembly protein TadD